MTKANGKLLITGEYFVLDGAKAVAVPTKLGQSFKVKEQSRGYDLTWKSYDHQKKVWFSAKYSLYDFSILESTNKDTAKSLAKMLRACCQQNSDFLSNWKGYQVVSQLDFPLEWGLGSSSTLIQFLAEWAEVNPFILLFDTIGGSGYDVACASAEGPISYTLMEDQLSIDHLEQPLPFSAHWYFVYSGRKQSSADEINAYQKIKKDKTSYLQKVSEFSTSLIKSRTLGELKEIFLQHESLVGEFLDREPLGKQFDDFHGVIKSSGAWGGDFFIALSEISEAETKKYFQGKGYKTIFSYKDLIL